MGSLPSTLRDEQSLLSIGTENVLDESFVRDQYKSSPLRTMVEGLSGVQLDTHFSSKDFEAFSFLTRSNIGSEEYNKALVSQTPELKQLNELSGMRSELIGRIGLQTRQEMEENV